MQNQKAPQNKFFLSVWIIFLILLPAYSIYVLLTATDLALYLQPHTDQIVPYVSFRIILGIYFFIAILSIKKIFNNKLWLGAIILVGIISRIILIPSQPVLEDDYYRYLWDGAVTANGFNPYIFSPDDAIKNTNDIPAELKKLAKESGEVIININHPHVRTIYPALAQGVFAVSYIIAPWQSWMWKSILLLFDIVVLLFLFLILKHIRLPLALLAIYWLNPIVIHEFFNAAHMDLLAILFVTISIYLYLKNKYWMAIVSIAIATGFKLYPLVLLALFLRSFWKNKQTFTFYLLGYLTIVVILFIPVLASNLNESLGFIRYAERWINNAAVYSIFRDTVSYVTNWLGLQINIHPRILIVLIYLSLVFFIIRKEPNNQNRFLEKTLLIIATLYLISPTQFPWYYTWMVPLLVFKPKVSLLFYAALLPLYQLNYISPALIYIQHLPVLAAFIWELKYKKTEYFFYPTSV
ncbi:MAG: hypothetical protein KJN64_09970 [Ignavibacteria bacterium]|nr:hypothetical protein [Ignavibacteria bacterium]MBT8392962.1 hypothetical protein [Ignavibacteria bacterium]NNJ53883.1 hypothetical protein [Ignavibacteriaceae bacterium]NNL19749.1 hypothetical protein [Ignavibacteriaceae bacterium]